MNLLHNHHRRSFLKGVSLGAGAVVLQPVLQSLAAAAAGKEMPPRVIFFVESNGLFAHHIQPKPKNAEASVDDRRGAGERLVDVSLADYELPDAISPLAPLKDRVTVLQGLSGKVVGPGHSKTCGTLGCYNPKTQGVFAQTVDCAMGDSLSSIIPVMGLGVPPGASRSVMYNVSATAPGRLLPIQCNPERAFQSLFGSVAGGDAAKKLTLRNNLLDYMKSDIRRVRNALAGVERERFDVYLEAYESLRARQDKVSKISDRLKARMPATDKFASPAENDRFESQCDLAVATLLSGLSNVVTIDASCGDGLYIQWASLGIKKNGHDIGHGAGEDGKTSDELRGMIRKYHAERLAAMAKKLDSVKEGNGTVLDNTLIVYLSDSAEAHHGFCAQWPMVLIGNLGGRLKAGGRLLEYPSYGKNGHRTTANLYLALLQAIGSRRETFGTEDRGLKDIDTSGPLAELLA